MRNNPRSAWFPCRAALFTLAAMLSIGLGGCNHPAADPGVLAADPDLQYLNPSLELSEIQLGPGDQIGVQVFRQPDLDRTVEIPRSSVIFLPLAGDIDTRGTTVSTLRQRITDAYVPYVVDPQVTVNVAVRRSQRVLVLGEVQQSGVYNLDRPTDALTTIAQAGGFTQAGAKDAVYLHRLENGEPVQRVLDMDLLLNDGAFENNPLVEPGDIIYVPPTVYAKGDRFARHVSTWLTPILLTQSAILNGQAIDRGFGLSGGSGVIIGGQ